MTSDISYKKLPPKEVIQQIVERRRAHITNLSSYMWYILPVAKKFGDKVYEVAAKSLTSSGIPTTADQLKRLGEEMQSPEWEIHYEEEKHSHIGTNLTSDRWVTGRLLPNQDE